MIEFPSINVMTPARTREEICLMAADMLETLVNIPTYSASVMLLDGDCLEVTSNYRSERSSAGSFSPKLVIAEVDGRATFGVHWTAVAQVRPNRHWRR